MPSNAPATPSSKPSSSPAVYTRRNQCRHIFTDGHRCGSPALRGEHLCYYHTRSRRQGLAAGRAGTFILPPIDDRPALHIALYDVLSRMSTGDIDLKRGTSLLYGLQIASSNLRGIDLAAIEHVSQVEEFTDNLDLGDLAPIAEYVEPAPTPAASSSPGAAEGSASEAQPAGAPFMEQPHRDMGAVSTTPEPTTPVILSERSEPKDPEAPNPAPTAHSLPSIPLPEPVLNRTLRPPTRAQILKRRIPAFMHNSPCRDYPLYPVVRNEVIFRPTDEDLAEETEPPRQPLVPDPCSMTPCYTGVNHDSHPPMAS